MGLSYRLPCLVATYWQHDPSPPRYRQSPAYYSAQPTLPTMCEAWQASRCCVNSGRKEQCAIVFCCLPGMCRRSLWALAHCALLLQALSTVLRTWQAIHSSFIRWVDWTIHKHSHRHEIEYSHLRMVRGKLERTYSTLSRQSGVFRGFRQSLHRT